MSTFRFIQDGNNFPDEYDAGNCEYDDGAIDQKGDAYSFTETYPGSEPLYSSKYISSGYLNYLPPLVFSPDLKDCFIEIPSEELNYNREDGSSGYRVTLDGTKEMRGLSSEFHRIFNPDTFISGSVGCAESSHLVATLHSDGALKIFDTYDGFLWQVVETTIPFNISDIDSSYIGFCISEGGQIIFPVTGTTTAWVFDAVGENGWYSGTIDISFYSGYVFYAGNLNSPNGSVDKPADTFHVAGAVDTSGTALDSIYGYDLSDFSLYETVSATEIQGKRLLFGFYNFLSEKKTTGQTTTWYLYPAYNFSWYDTDHHDCIWYCPDAFGSYVQADAGVYISNVTDYIGTANPIIVGIDSWSDFDGDGIFGFSVCAIGFPGTNFYTECVGGSEYISTDSTTVYHEYMGGNSGYYFLNGWCRSGSGNSIIVSGKSYLPAEGSITAEKFIAWSFFVDGTVEDDDYKVVLFITGDDGSWFSKDDFLVYGNQMIGG